MTKAPAFQFYAHDFLAGRVATYSLEEVGAYSLLLAFDWSLNGLPTEPEKLARLLRVSARKFAVIWAAISEQFPVQDGRRHNPRLQLEREKQAANRQKKIDAANRRWKADADARALQAQCSPSPTPSPTSSSKGRSPQKTAAKAGWVQALGDEWKSLVGRANYGRIGSDLKEAHEAHGVTALRRAMRWYIASEKAAKRTPKWPWFVDGLAVALERSSVPLTVIDGEMSPELEALTRPASVRRQA